MSAQFTGRLPEWGLLHRTLGTVTGGGGGDWASAAFRGWIGALGRWAWQVHVSEFPFFFVLRTPGPITHAGQEDAGRV